MTPDDGWLVFAPGKLVVIGEYAVLHGERAMVTAVDVGIECHCSPRPEGWWLSAPDLGVDVPLAQAADAPGAGLLAAAATAGAATFPETPPHHLTVRGRGNGAERKTGLGCSAASTVAILGCFAAANGHDLADPRTRADLFDLALRTHRAHQNGRGSGIDVAASVYGGWLAYTLTNARPRIERADVPDDLRLATAWTGFTVDTPAGLTDFGRTPHSPELLGQMRATLERFWTAGRTGSGRQLLDAVAAYGRILDYVSWELGGGLLGKRTRELVQAATECGVAAKGSGAVGGDCVIALDTHPARLDAARSAWHQLGATVLDLNPEPHGVRPLTPATPPTPANT
uniref:Phosphomevalonate kinase n=1 Tax=Streptomyces sp. NBC_00180 TaxID=2903632 RepID=A0AAU1IAW7_9ACTN